GENGNGEDGTKVLGKDPYTAEEITLRSGRFGPYIQRGDGKEAKRSSLPKGWTVDSIDHEKALALLSLPRDVGKHPESGKMISAGLGRYGPFVLHDGTYANLDNIEDVFSISGRGTVVTGRVERGVVKVGEELEIIGIRPTTKTTCTGVEMFRKLLDQGQAGDNIGALLRGVDREGVERGQVLAKPGTVKPHKKFVAEAYILTKDEGGRHTPFFTNYRPQFYFRTTDVTGIVSLPEGTEMVMPGDNITVDVELIVPIAMEEKLRFAIREGGRTVGAGIVVTIKE
ncbi:MAG: hypothetical protein E5W78_06055, partial [Mesorhizobium sp.]